MCYKLPVQLLHRYSSRADLGGWRAERVGAKTTSIYTYIYIYMFFNIPVVSVAQYSRRFLGDLLNFLKITKILLLHLHRKPCNCPKIIFVGSCRKPFSSTYSVVGWEIFFCFFLLMRMMRLRKNLGPFAIFGFSGPFLRFSFFY